MRETYCDICNKKIEDKDWLKLLVSFAKKTSDMKFSLSVTKSNIESSDDICVECFNAMKAIFPLIGLCKGDIIKVFTIIKNNKSMSLEAFREIQCGVFKFPYNYNIDGYIQYIVDYNRGTANSKIEEAIQETIERIDKTLASPDVDGITKQVVNFSLKRVQLARREEQKILKKKLASIV